MSRSATRLLCALPLVLLLNATGCQFESVAMELPSFFSAGIDELWFWRRDEATNAYVRAGHMRLLGTSGPAGDQKLGYTLYNPQGEEGFTLEMPVEVAGDSIRVVLWFANWMEDGTFKVSARNTAGESALSSASVTL
jgi:hypothetical protein